MASTLRILAPDKFRDPALTAKGETRATIALEALETLWVNTGTLCNIECKNCYIESSPTNDALSYLQLSELIPFLDEAATLGTREIGFTGGEPFLNPQFPQFLRAALERGFDVLVLTNGMQPMQRARVKRELVDLHDRFGGRITMRVSVDHYERAHHEEERGAGSWQSTIEGLRWLAEAGFRLNVAGRTLWGDNEIANRAGFADLFARECIPVDAHHPGELILFPEMDESVDVPEITTACWGILDKDPREVMCASSRMLVKRRGAAQPALVACTLLPYDLRFEMGHTLAQASGDVALNHPHCAKFCVLGGGSCSA